MKWTLFQCLWLNQEPFNSSPRVFVCTQIKLTGSFACTDHSGFDFLVILFRYGNLFSQGWFYSKKPRAATAPTTQWDLICSNVSLPHSCLSVRSFFMKKVEFPRFHLYIGTGWLLVIGRHMKSWMHAWCLVGYTSWFGMIHTIVFMIIFAWKTHNSLICYEDTKKPYISNNCNPVPSFFRSLRDERSREGCRCERIYDISCKDKQGKGEGVHGVLEIYPG